eukprot:114676-Hanusia_phi.AAC.1
MARLIICYSSVTVTSSERYSEERGGIEEGNRNAVAMQSSEEGTWRVDVGERKLGAKCAPSPIT